MRWPPIGTTVALHKTVAPSDRAAFDDEEIHDVYSTVAQVRDVEHVGRWLFRRCLEDGEEGAGAEVHVRHRTPVPVGADVVVVAEVTEAAAKKMVIRAQVCHDGLVATEATFTQVMIDTSTW